MAEQNEKKSFRCSLSTCSETIQHSLERLFGNLGRIVATKPWLTIVISVAVTLCFTAGFSNWTTESRAEKLWVHSTFLINPM